MAPAMATDVELMVALAKDMAHGTGEVDEFVVRMRELKGRELVWQSKIGRPMPTAKGRPLWDHAFSIVAGGILYGRAAESRRPCFVVFDTEGRPLAFRCWDDAVAFARWLMGAASMSFSAVENPEDLVESWERAHLSPVEAARLESEGAVPIPSPADEGVD